MLNPVRVLKLQIGTTPEVLTLMPYEFRRVVNGWFGHRHLPNGYVLCYREPRTDVAADTGEPATWYPAIPQSPFFLCRPAAGGGFTSLTDDDIAALSAYFALRGFHS